MSVSLVDDSSLLAINVGSSFTRAVLFDVVDGQYRFIASGKASSTAEAPFRNVSLGVHEAIEKLQTVTGKLLFDKENNLITPARPDGSGVDAIAATLSVGPTLRCVVVGLLSDVSLDSARRLAETAYLRIVESIGLNDPRKSDEQIDAILRAQPDVVILAGGTDGGASRSVQKNLETVGLASFLMPPEKRPSMLYAGNHSLTDSVEESLQNLSPSFHFSHNIRPSLDTEDLAPAARELAQVYVDVHKRQIPGIEELAMWSSGHILPTAYAEGRMIRFLSQMSGAGRGILGVDIGAPAAMVAAGFNGKLTLGVYPQFGMGDQLPGLLKFTQLEDILRWLRVDIAPSVVRDYLYQLSLCPGTIPATKEDHAIVSAISRQALHLALQHAKRSFSPEARYLKKGLLPLMEPILASGSILSDAPTPGQSLLFLLDALQPVGITSLILDQNNLLPLLGVAADFNHLLPVQVLESGAFMSLGTVVSVISSANYGSRVLRARLTYSDGSDAQADIKFGELEILPLSIGQTARLTMQTSRGSDVGNGPGRNVALQVVGGAMGVVIDARGRPLYLSQDPVRRRELFNKWLWTVGG